MCHASTKEMTLCSSNVVLHRGTFSSAVLDMNLKKKVRRRAWVDDEKLPRHIFTNEWKGISAFHKRAWYCGVLPWTPTIEDFESRDWEVVE